MPGTEAQTGYAQVGDLEMYYEVHGSGPPLILLHGASMTIDMMGPILPGLATTRRVIAVEQQGHGHTVSADRAQSRRLPQARREAHAAPASGFSTAPGGCSR